MNYYLAVLKKYAEFNGRARRSEYWYFVLFNILISGMFLFISTYTPVFMFGYYIYRIAIIIPSIAVSVRRMHDVNKSGWFVLIPIYNIILACTAGTAGTNEYGYDPKNPEYLDEVEEIGKDI